MKKPLLSGVAVLFLASPACAQNQSFYGPNGSVAGSSTTIGNTTSFYGPNGNLTGSSTRVGNSTSIYDNQGRFQGMVTNTGPSSFDRAFKFKR
jgi:YD repeat-containing protein